MARQACRKLPGPRPAPLSSHSCAARGPRHLCFTETAEGARQARLPPPGRRKSCAWETVWTLKPVRTDGAGRARRPAAGAGTGPGRVSGRSRPRPASPGVSLPLGASCLCRWHSPESPGESLPLAVASWHRSKGATRVTTMFSMCVAGSLTTEIPRSAHRYPNASREGGRSPRRQPHHPPPFDMSRS